MTDIHARTSAAFLADAKARCDAAASMPADAAAADQAIAAIEAGLIEGGAIEAPTMKDGDWVVTCNLGINAGHGRIISTGPVWAILTDERGRSTGETVDIGTALVKWEDGTHGRYRRTELRVVEFQPQPAMVPQQAQQQQACAGPINHDVRRVPCELCQGTGELVTDWGRYLHAQPGDVGDESVVECDACDGAGYVDALAMVPMPVQQQQARDARHAQGILLPGCIPERETRRGMARCEYPGCWQIGIWSVQKGGGCGRWVARATGPGTIGTGSAQFFDSLAEAYLGLTGEPMPGAR